MNAPARKVAELINVLNGLAFHALNPYAPRPRPLSRPCHASYSQKAPAIPYVYQLANRLAAMETRYAKIGTPTASTKAAPLARMIKIVHAVQPRAVCSCRWRVWRNMRMKKSFAAVWEYRLPAIRKLGSAMPYYVRCTHMSAWHNGKAREESVWRTVALAHFGGREENAGDCTEGPR